MPRETDVHTVDSVRVIPRNKMSLLFSTTVKNPPPSCFLAIQPGVSVPDWLSRVVGLQSSHKWNWVELFLCNHGRLIPGSPQDPIAKSSEAQPPSIKWYKFPYNLHIASCLFFFLIFIGVALLYNVMLASTVQQSGSAIRVHISPLFWISFPFRSPQSTE